MFIHLIENLASTAAWARVCVLTMTTESLPSFCCSLIAFLRKGLSNGWLRLVFPPTPLPRCVRRGSSTAPLNPLVYHSHLSIIRTNSLGADKQVTLIYSLFGKLNCCAHFQATFSKQITLTAVFLHISDSNTHALYETYLELQYLLDAFSRNLSSVRCIKGAHYYYGVWTSKKINIKF